MTQEEATAAEGMKKQQKEKSKVQIGGGIKRQQETIRGREGGGDKEGGREGEGKPHLPPYHCRSQAPKQTLTT